MLVGIAIYTWHSIGMTLKNVTVMSPRLQQVLTEIEQLSQEEQLAVLNHTAEQLKQTTKASPIWAAYLASKEERKEVYRRLADS